MSDVRLILERVDKGGEQSGDELVRILYDELRRLARIAAAVVRANASHNRKEVRALVAVQVDIIEVRGLRE
jgi:hypothetical protein